jgi:hypothetical protein
MTLKNVTNLEHSKRDENDALLADSHITFNRWKNYSCQLMNVQDVVRQTEMHKAEPLMPKPSSFEVEIVAEKLTKYKSPGIDQILTELIQAGSNT